MNFRLLFLDLDGTLICKNNIISSENRAAIKAVSEKGIKVVIASGRCKAMTASLSNELGLTKYGKNYSISLNGAVISDIVTGATLHTVPMPFELAGRLFEKALELGIDSHFYSENTIYFKHKNSEITKFYEQYDCNCISLNKQYLDINEVPLKYILLDDDHNLLERFKQEMQPYVNGILHADYSSARSLEYNSISASKGLGLKYITKCFNEELKNVIAMGDGENDISMLKVAGLGIAPKNALDNVKQAACFVTENTCENNAVKEVIEKFFT